MKNLFKHILFGAAIFAGMGLFVGCDTMTDDEIEKLINDKLNDNATADATPPVELAGTTWVAYLKEWTREEYDEDLSEILKYIPEYLEKHDMEFRIAKENIIQFFATEKKIDKALLNRYILDNISSLLLMASVLIPGKIDEARVLYGRMIRDGYPLDYLNVEYNIDEAMEQSIRDLKTKKEQKL